MVFVGYKIEGIDVDRVPTEYLPTGGNPHTVYLRLEQNPRDFDADEKLNIDLNAELIALWIDKFNQEVDAWLEEEDDIVMPDDLQPKIEYDTTNKSGCLRVEGITLEDIEGIAEPLKGFISHINEYIENELNRREEFKEHVEHINSEYFGEAEKGPKEIKVKTLWD